MEPVCKIEAGTSVNIKRTDGKFHDHWSCQIKNSYWYCMVLSVSTKKFLKFFLYKFERKLKNFKFFM